MYKKIGLEKDINLKARFLELLFLISTLLLVFNPSTYDKYFLGNLLAFSVFGFLLYTEVLNGEVPESLSDTITVGFTFSGVLVMALRPLFSQPEFPVAVIYFLTIGYIISIGLLEQDSFWARFHRYSLGTITGFLKSIAEMEKDEIKKALHHEKTHLFYAFISSFALLTGLLLLWTEATSATITTNHVIQLLVGTFIASPFVDRWIIS